METIDIAKIVDSLLDWRTWIVISVVSIFGMLGGYAHKLTSPPDDKTPLPRYIVVGMVASLAVLFVFIPKDPVRLIALSLVAGYGGKAILDALEARVKTALAQAETAKAKDEGKKAVESGKEAINYAQKLSLINNALIKEQPKETTLETIKATLPTTVHSFVAKSPETIADELKQLAAELNIIEKSFQK